ncbi:hypothetical protein LTR36_005128 [Oleoguttula mirabilis]|uniref:Uncharacterized protein n=1 Tax=Oleoguttula mirabilis TaxID=1507867 RepID=A0AAV9JXM6_9PEZI|nr:hypothetical protein LTR36_005128 [Oleoguttula mirabilis]
MGQRSQLFIIAKINGRHRVLAAAHHQNFYGRLTIRQCLHLLQILRSEANRIDIRRELSRAERQDWNELLPTNGKETSYPTAPFPFLATCLAVGAGLHDEYQYSHGVSHLPLDIGYADSDNNDGISFYDVTDPANPRYGFVFFRDTYGAGTYDSDGEHIGDEMDDAAVVAMSVVDGRSYLNTYETPQEQKEMSDDSRFADVVECSLPKELSVDSLLADLGKYWLVTAAALESIWGDQGWSDAIQGPTARLDASVSRTTLKQKALDRTIDVALDHATDDLDWLLEAEQLPAFIPAVLAKLRSTPTLIQKSGAIPLLVRVFKAGSDVDLSMFGDLQPSQALAIVEGVCRGSPRCCIALSLPDFATWSIEDVEDITSLGCITALHLGETPDISLEALLCLVAKQPTIERFSCSALFDLESRLNGVESERGSNSFPVGQNTPFPLVQAVYIRQCGLAVEDTGRQIPGLPDGGGGVVWSKRLVDPPRMKGAGTLYKDIYGNVSVFTVPLRDALLCTDRICRDVPDMVRRVFAARDDGFGPYSRDGAGLAMKLALQEGHALGPIPLELRHDDSYNLGRCELPRPMRPPRTNEWTLLLIHEKPMPIHTKRAHYGEAVDALRYAFVSVGANNKLQVLDADAFFDVTMPANAHDGPQRAASHSATWSRNLQRHADGTLATALRKPQISSCTPAEAQEAFTFLDQHNKAIEEHSKKK